MYTSVKAVDWSVYAGDYSLSKEANYEQKVGVKKIILHPNFKMDVLKGGNGWFAAAENDVGTYNMYNQSYVK